MMLVPTPVLSTLVGLALMGLGAFLILFGLAWKKARHIEQKVEDTEPCEDEEN